MSQVLIIGAAGNIGRRLLRHFDGAIGVDRVAGCDLRVDLSEPIVPGDSFDRALQEAQCVVHLATSANPEAPPKVHLAAIAETASLLCACARHTVSHVVLPSSNWVEPRDPQLFSNAYGQSKRAIEAMAVVYSRLPECRATALRIGWVPAKASAAIGAPDWLARDYWDDARLCAEFDRLVTGG